MSNKSLSRYEYFSVLVLAALSAVLHTFVYFEYYDFTKGLWQKDTAVFLKIASFLPLIPTVILALVLVAVLKKGSADERASLHLGETLFSRIAAYVVAACLVFTVVAQILSIGSDNKLAALLNSHSGSYMALTATLHIMTLLAAFFAAGYFFFRAQKKILTGLGITAVCYFVFYTLRMYFDMTMHINNPRWSFGVLTLVLLLLYFVLEIDQLLFAEKPFLYTVCACLALVAGFSYSVGELAMAIGGKTDEGLSLAYPVLIFASSLYIAARLYTVFFADLTYKALPDASTDAVDIADTADTVEPSDVTLFSDEISGSAIGDVAEDSEDSEDAEDAEYGIPELTQEELKCFYSAIYGIVAKKRGVGEDSGEEAKKEVRREVLAMLSHLLEGDSRSENIENMRAFLKRLEG